LGVDWRGLGVVWRARVGGWVGFEGVRFVRFVCLSRVCPGSPRPRGLFTGTRYLPRYPVHKRNRGTNYQVASTPPSIAIEAPVLGGPVSVRVCVSQQQQPAELPRQLIISADGPQCRSPRPTASRLPSVASRKRCPSEVGRAALQLDRAPYTEYARPHQACTLGRAR